MIGNKFLSVAGASEPTDAQFNYVTMLLHGDGTNGAQNNTFTDSSTNNFTITRNGNTTQGSFSPYGSNWSNYFDGTGDYLTNTSVALITAAVSTFTTEAWIYMTANPTSDSNYLGSMIALDGEAANTTNYLSFGPISTRKLRMRWFDGASKYAEGSTTLALNTWYHIAVVVTSNSIKMYVNGVAETLTGTTTLTARSGTASDFSVGANYYSTFWGYISNLRVTTTAVYSSAFTPPTTPLTSIANTVLLTCQSNRFIDNSTNAYALTVGGTPSVQRFNPFGTSTAYSTATIGGSGYFDGTGDYLTGPTTNSAFDFGSGDWTVETWAFPTAFSSQMAVFISLDNATSSAYAIGLLINTNGSVRVYQYGGSYFINSTSTTGVVSLNSWSHIVAVRSGSTFAIFVNGTRVASVTGVSGTQAANKTVNIGQDPYASNLRYSGYLSDLRVVKGTAVYDPTQTTITIPNTPLSAVTNTQLLLSNTNAAIYDNAMMNDLETVGNAQISTSVKKYGTGSMAFDGSGDYLKTRKDVTVGDLGSGDFTLECWIQVNTTDAMDFFGTGTWSYYIGSGQSGWAVSQIGSLVAFSYQVNNSWIVAQAFFETNLSTGTWYHVAIVRASGVIRCYLNGTVSSTTISNTSNIVSTLTSGLIVGGGSDPNAYNMNGYIDDLRITKGYARYTANFTPPTAALPDKGT